VYARHIGFFGEIENAGIARECYNLLHLLTVTQEQVKIRTSNLADAITGYI